MTTGARIYSAKHNEHGVLVGWLGLHRDIAALALDGGARGWAHQSDILPSIVGRVRELSVDRSPEYDQTADPGWPAA